MGNLTDHFAGGGGSNILEQVYFQPDGRSVPTAQGNKTAPNCTAYQIIASTSATQLTNMNFSYTPPAGTTKVLIEVRVSGRANNSGNKYPLPTIYMRLDNTVITDSKWGGYFYTAGRSEDQFDPTIAAEININGTDDIANNSVATWAADKTISFIGLSFDTNQHSYILHNTRYGSPTNGQSSNTTEYNIPPKYKITAYK